MTIPQKLHSGNEIRVIAPATSLNIVPQEVRVIANENLANMGLVISFSEHAEESDLFSSSSVQSRIADLHSAFGDPKVKGIFTAIGGYNSNQLLKEIDYELIRLNPKVFCGYSDITVLQNAIFAKTGLVTYYGPHYSTFGMLKGLEYTIEQFRMCVMEEQSFEIVPASTWSDDEWYLDQHHRNFVQNNGWKVVHEGDAAGTLLGGNLCTLNLLHGTEYMPSIEGSLVLIEDDSECTPRIFDRDLQSLLHQPNFSQVKALLIGRFQKASNINLEVVETIIKSKKELNKIPVVINVDFGHTTPQFTFPIGGKGELTARKDGVRFILTEH